MIQNGRTSFGNFDHFIEYEPSRSGGASKSTWRDMSLVTAGPSNNQAHRTAQNTDQRMVRRARGELSIKFIGSKCRRDCRWIGAILSRRLSGKLKQPRKKPQSFILLCKLRMDQARLLIGKRCLYDAIQSVGSKCQTPRMTLRSRKQSWWIDRGHCARSKHASNAGGQALRAVDYYRPVRQRSIFDP